MIERTTKLYKQKKVWIVLLGTIFLCLFILNTDPNNLSLPLLLLPPALIFFIIYLSVSVILTAFTNIPQSRLRLISLVLSTLPVTLLLLASLGQLTVRDTVLSLLFMGGMAFYFSHYRLTNT